VRGLFVTGTDTEVGKTIVAAAIVAALVANGLRVAAFNPAVTGLDEPTADPWPRDHELLGMLTAADPATVTPRTFGPAVSPHLAAEHTGTPLDPAALVAAARKAGEDADALIVEGVGGLLVPLTMGYAIRDFALDLGLELVIAARPGLGTINHTLLTLESARGAGLTVRAVVLGPWPVQPSAIEVSNRDTIAALGQVEVATLDEIPGPHALAAAGARLAPGRWLQAL
jgi:dethiobiotin synthetase